MSRCREGGREGEHKLPVTKVNEPMEGTDEDSADSEIRSEPGKIFHMVVVANSKDYRRAVK